MQDSNNLTSRQFNKKHVLHALACVAVHPSLQAVLIIDPPPGMMRIFVQTLHQFMETAGFLVAMPIQYLPLEATEDELWSKLSFDNLHIQRKLRIKNKARLVQAPTGNEFQLLAVSDLSNLGLPAKKALTVLLDASCVHVERHGLQQSWSPRIQCIAFCQKTHLPYMSRHLLDRFAVRLDASRWEDSLEERKLSILQTVKNPSPILQEIHQEQIPVLAQDLLSKIRNRSSELPRLDNPDTFEKILEYGDRFGGTRRRREIALSRMAAAVAMLEQQESVAPEHVQQALDMQKFSYPQKAVRAEEMTTSQHKQSPEQIFFPGEREPGSQEFPSEQPGTGQLIEIASSPDETCRHGEMPSENDDFPEDALAHETMLATLQVFWNAKQQQHIYAGRIIGSVQVRRLNDIAFLDTVKAAAPFQKIRGRKPGKPLLVQPQDLRQNRRAETPRQLLMLVIDQSNSIEIEWQQFLRQELEWAYTHRAPITLILVGAGRDDDRQARLHLLASRQLAAITKALQGRKGCASPLAHGLYLALQQIERSTRHGRNVFHEIRLIVATDGRANVPLSFSRDDKTFQKVPGLRGFEDAVGLAQKIRQNSRVRVTLKVPETRFHQELPLRLAMALGAEHQRI